MSKLTIQSAYDAVKKIGAHEVAQYDKNVAENEDYHTEMWTLARGAYKILAIYFTWEYADQSGTRLMLHILNKKGTLLRADKRWIEGEKEPEWFEWGPVYLKKYWNKVF